MTPRRLVTRILLVAATVLSIVLPATPPCEAAGTITAGEFARAFADALNTSTGSIRTFEEARTFLAGRGVALPADLDPAAPLSEGMMSAIVTRAGMPAFSSRPERTIDADTAGEFLAGLEQASPVPQQDDAAGQLEASANRGGKPAALGACCVAGSCSQTGASYCASIGGVFRGSGVGCTPDPCATGVGTCCLGRLGPCTFTQPTECDGRFRGTQVCTRKTCSREAESPVQP